jgi:hypothetical protein
MFVGLSLPSIELLGLMLGTQLILTLYGAGLRRPFGSLRTVKTAPAWLRENNAPVLIADLVFAAAMLGTWAYLFTRLDLLPFLVSFFLFAALGGFLSHRVGLLHSLLVSVICAMVVAYLMLHQGRLLGV